MGGGLELSWGRGDYRLCSGGINNKMSIKCNKPSCSKRIWLDRRHFIRYNYTVHYWKPSQRNSPLYHVTRTQERNKSIITFFPLID